MNFVRINVISLALISLFSTTAVAQDATTEFMEVEEIFGQDEQSEAAASSSGIPSELPEEFVDLERILYGNEASPESAEKQSAPVDSVSLQQDIQQLKEKVLEANRELFTLEEDLLFPSNTQVNVFVAFDALEYFQLDSVNLKINSVPVSNHLYTEREIDALHRGAVQRLYTGNLPVGEHEIIAIFTGIGPEGRDYRRAVNITFGKSAGTKYIQLSVEGDDLRKRPSFRIKQWE